MGVSTIIVDVGNTTLRAASLSASGVENSIEVPCVFGMAKNKLLEAIQKKGILTIKRPIQKDDLVDSDILVKILKKVVEQLSPTCKQMVLSLNIPQKHFKMIFEIVISELNLKTLVILPRTLAAAATALKSPNLIPQKSHVVEKLNTKKDVIVTNIGSSSSSVANVINGKISQISSIPIGGEHMTSHLQRMFEGKGVRFWVKNDLSLLEQCKISTSRVALDFEEELMESQLSNDKQVSFELPDGFDVAVEDSYRISCTEIVLQPSLTGLDIDGIEDLMIKESKKYPNATKICFGSPFKTDGMVQRLQKQCSSLQVSLDCNVMNGLFNIASHFK